MHIDVIAEIGVNHDGKLNRALALLDAAKQAGADVAKFQLWRGRPELEHLRLVVPQLMRCAAHCSDVDIEFMCTAHDMPSLDEVLSLGVKRLKLASTAIVNKKLLRAVAATRRPVIMSTGMSTLDEVKKVMWDYIFYTHQLTLLHCVSAYPAPIGELNLRCINTLKRFGVPVGYSDHSANPHALYAAVALGATTIEAHLTYDTQAEGPDHSSSYMPIRLRQAIMGIRQIEQMLGDGNKVVQESEMALRAQTQ